LNTSELVPKITEAHSVTKMRAQGIVDSMLKGFTSARGRNRGRPFKMTAAWRGSPRPGNPCAARRLRSPFAKAHLFTQGGERGAEQLNVFAVVGR
jgi:hypothetical protein